jgi:hypothetical protein
MLLCCCGLRRLRRRWLLRWLRRRRLLLRRLLLHRLLLLLGPRQQLAAAKRAPLGTALSSGSTSTSSPSVSMSPAARRGVCRELGKPGERIGDPGGHLESELGPTPAGHEVLDVRANTGLVLQLLARLEEQPVAAWLWAGPPRAPRCRQRRGRARAHHGRVVVEAAAATAAVAPAAARCCRAGAGRYYLLNSLSSGARLAGRRRVMRALPAPAKRTAARRQRLGCSPSSAPARRPACASPRAAGHAIARARRGAAWPRRQRR